MEHIQNGRTMVTPPRGSAAAKAAVHPGWLSPDRVVVEEVHEPGAEEATRFAAVSQLLRTAGALDRAAADALADLGLTAGAFFALLELSASSPMGLAPSELARRLAVARRTATLYVDILTRQGWVERNAHPDDRRMVLASLTAHGETLVNDLSSAYKRRLADLLRDMTPLQAERMRQLLTLVPVGPQSDVEVDSNS
jgi:DNA-binding MarR family transcriptional regulator